MYNNGIISDHLLSNWFSDLRRLQTGLRRKTKQLYEEDYILLSHIFSHEGQAFNFRSVALRFVREWLVMFVLRAHCLDLAV